MPDPIHLHSERAKFNPQTFLLLIPSVLFVVALAFSYRVFSHPSSITDGRQPVQALDPVKTPTPQTTITVGGHPVKVEMANTEVLRRLGLSGRSQLSPGEGMLFSFDQENVKPAFWMKDMIIPIDIVWIDDNTVIQIHESVQPPAPETADRDLKLYLPNAPIDSVLELPAGYAKEVGIAVGDIVQ